MEDKTAPRQALAMIEAFRDLGAEEIARLEAELEVKELKRGDILIRQGDIADTLYLVVSGRFAVTIHGVTGSVAEIRSGTPIGEIAFFAGGTRTATVTALRDCLVLTLDRAAFDRLCARHPQIWPAITAALARRLARSTAGAVAQRPMRPRTLAICLAGRAPVPAAALGDLVKAFGARQKCIVFDAESLANSIDLAKGFDDAAVTAWLNAQESRYELVIYLCASELDGWSKKALRQADEVILLGRLDGGPGAFELNSLEAFAAGLADERPHRLLLLRDQGSLIRGTSAWLSRRNVKMVHHGTIGDAGDYARLVRFVLGEAVGFVACGGGAFCAAHVGVYKALRAMGVEIDIWGGTSGGGAMAAAFAMGLEPEEIDKRIHEIFVSSRSLKRMTWPRYGLLDHTEFDRQLARHFTEGDIEDLPTPFFAVSTNLSRNELQCHQRGTLWRAVRATGSIPGLLPPVYTDDGEMLVDGGLLDNLPVKTMRALKGGPNIVVNFVHASDERFHVDYDLLPGRKQLFLQSINPFRRAYRPAAPGVAGVLMRSLFAHRQDFASAMTADDLLLTPPLRAGMTIMHWQYHGELLQAAYAYARKELAQRSAEGHAIFSR